MDARPLANRRIARLAGVATSPLMVGTAALTQTSRIASDTIKNRLAPDQMLLLNT